LATKQGNILIVDDETSVRRVIQRKLSAEGYHCREAVNADQALSELKRHPIELVLLDIFMPRMDGYSTLGEIKKDINTKEVPVVMVTAVGQELNKILAKQLGAAGYITKPFKSPELLETINNLLPAS
jgi:two-component system alkaline phosphatase synthesis response regulator PhoP